MVWQWALKSSWYWQTIPESRSWEQRMMLWIIISWRRVRFATWQCWPPKISDRSFLSLAFGPKYSLIHLSDSKQRGLQHKHEVVKLCRIFPFSPLSHPSLPSSIKAPIFDDIFFNEWILAEKCSCARSCSPIQLPLCCTLVWHIHFGH